MTVHEYPRSHGSLSGLSDTDHHRQYALDLQGVIADRPAPGRRGRFYTATDEGVTYRDTGSTWTTLPGDAFLRRSGGALTGAVTLSPGGAFDTRIGAKPAADLPDTYPVGVSSMEFGSGTAGWPVTDGSVLTLRQGAYSMQVLNEAASGGVPARTFLRYGFGSAPGAWGPFQRLMVANGAGVTTHPHAGVAPTQIPGPQIGDKLLLWANHPTSGVDRYGFGIQPSTLAAYVPPGNGAFGVRISHADAAEQAGRGIEVHRFQRDGHRQTGDHLRVGVVENPNAGTTMHLNTGSGLDLTFDALFAR